MSYEYDVVTSDDGKTWTTLGQGTRSTLWDVAFDGDIFVSVGDKGTIQTSHDGITWNLRNSGIGSRLETVRHINDGFVAVGESGTILTSDNGIDWTEQTSGVSVKLYDVTYGNGKYIAVGGTGQDDVILVSADGVNWTSVDHSYRIPFVAVAYGNGTFIALGENGQVYVSSDANNWPRTYLPGVSYPQDIIYADGRFVVVGVSGKVYVSDNDGETWAVNNEAGGVDEYIYSVAYGGGNLVGVTRYGHILISNDKGDNWTEEPSGFDERLDLYGVTAGDGGFVAVGERGLVLQSEDFGDPGDPDVNAVAADKAALTWGVIAGENTLPDDITGDLVNPLPISGANATTISWSVSPGGFIDTTTGAVTRPALADGDQTVTLTATISKGEASDTVVFVLTIIAADLTPDEAIAFVLENLDWDAIKGSNNAASQVTSGLNLANSGAYGTTIGWSAEPEGLVDADTGAVTRPAVGQPNKEVVLTATISKEGGEPRTKAFNLTILALPTPPPSGGSIPAYLITVKAGPGGTITPKTTTTLMGGSATFTVIPDDGYEVLDVLVDGESIGAVTTYTFHEVTRQHGISATFRRIFPLRDVAETDWFFDSVKYVFESDLMTGTESAQFSPFMATNRAMVVTILHRLEKTPDAPLSDFTDVLDGTWYTDSVSWAAANRIAEGFGDNRFGPDLSVTREQLACFFYRYSQYAGRDVSERALLTGFVDGDMTSEWAKEAMEWAVGSGLIRGKDGNVLEPTGPATRAELATMLGRFIEGNQ